tara:strand:+ start:49 stop:435 length:387 start_codon:yes stop_codon:yes gene_type:complete
MAGALDTLFKDVAKQVVADLGSSLDTTITYTRKASSTYNTSTGVVTSTDTSYASIKVPIEFIKSEEDTGREIRQAKLYITPDLIGGNQPTFNDEVTLSYAGETHAAQIVDIDTRRGGQVYLYTLLVRF